MADIKNLVLPLFEAVLTNDEISEPLKYIGMSFHLNKSGAIATCSHVLKSTDPDKTIIGINIKTNKYYKVKNIKCHKIYDFAIAETDIKNNIVLSLTRNDQILAGVDVIAYGVVIGGMNGQVLEMHPRILKGYIVRTGGSPLVDHAREACEISFPSLSGFSGTPLISNNLTQQIVGMLYGNHESEIEIYKSSEIIDGEKLHSEKIYKVLELGRAHTATDIRIFLTDLGYT